MKNFTLLFAFLLSCHTSLSAQRYLTETFDSVTVKEDQVYGVNATVLFLAAEMEAIPQALVMDVYQPYNDDDTDRPLIIIMHTGNFLPPQINGGCQGTHKDADTKAVATRLAKLGYVVASIDYRLGWNPIAPEQTTQVVTLINAVYRGVQDSKTAIRYFRKMYAEEDNLWGINPDKIVLWGMGTGGYVSFAAATLDTITDTYIPKFLTPAGPMIIEPINGNVEGTTVGVVPAGFPVFPEGDTLCYPNHVGYESDFNLAVNMGGSLGDTSWIDPNDVPVISFQVPTDPFAPCGVGIVVVPPPANLNVVEVMGSCTSQPIINALGINNCMVAANLTDDITQSANSLNGGIEGFYPFVLEDLTEGAPWQFTDVAEPYGIAGSDCDTDIATATNYIDTVMWYFAPRAFACLNLSTSVDDPLKAEDIGLKYAPNPAYDQIHFQTLSQYPVQDVYVYDLNGKLVSSQYGIQSTDFYVNRGSLSQGIYLVKLRLKEGVLTTKVAFY